MTTSLPLLARALQARVVVAEAVEEEPAPGQRRHGEDHVRVRRVRRDRCRAARAARPAGRRTSCRSRRSSTVLASPRRPRRSRRAASAPSGRGSPRVPSGPAEHAKPARGSLWRAARSISRARTDPLSSGRRAAQHARTRERRRPWLCMCALGHPDSAWAKSHALPSTRKSFALADAKLREPQTTNLEDKRRGV